MALQPRRCCSNRSAVEVIISVKIGFIVDDVADAAGYSPVIVPKIHHGWASTGHQVDVVRRCVCLIEHIREVRLQEETGHRIPIQCLANNVLFDFATLQLCKGFRIKEPLAVDRGMHEIVACH